ncbi:hypothetical protein PV10_01268 [Exophiala mesophila]|uniref:Uncharacterized protein n=1 Tax=Exophiala mesophila TaxID=212818 RepID=A0A0D1X6T3_EXOME|nr:uncharacterized protein PV10_01268 [Exophiala mesophila]KIV97525.1 hypothetical protein PV10_01268 [Exophiala mesophila]
MTPGRIAASYQSESIEACPITLSHCSILPRPWNNETNNIDVEALVTFTAPLITGHAACTSKSSRAYPCSLVPVLGRSANLAMMWCLVKPCSHIDPIDIQRPTLPNKPT